MPKSGDKAVVKVGGGFTINLGNYESAKLNVGIELEGDQDELEELWEKADKEVTEQLGKQLEGLKKKMEENDNKPLGGMLK